MQLLNSYSNSLYVLTHNRFMLARLRYYVITQELVTELLSAQCDYSYSPFPSLIMATRDYSDFHNSI